MIRVIFNPVQFLSHYALRKSIAYLGLNRQFFNLLTGIFGLAKTLYLQFGLGPTMRALFNIRDIFRRDVNIVRVILDNNPYLNPYIVLQLINLIVPYRRMLIQAIETLTPVRLFFLLCTYFTGIGFTLCRPLMLYIFRFAGFVVFGSITVLWNEFLSSIPLLKSMALFFTDFLLDQFNLLIPKNVDFNKENLPNKENMNHESYFFSALTLVLLSVAAVTIGSMFFAEWYNPEYYHSLPVIGDVPNYLRSGYNGTTNFISGCYHSTTNYISNWWYGNPAGDAGNLPGAESNASTPTDIELKDIRTSTATDSISRSSSGSSTVKAPTPRRILSSTPLDSDSIITPPVTPEPKVNPWIN